MRTPSFPFFSTGINCNFWSFSLPRRKVGGREKRGRGESWSYSFPLAPTPPPPPLPNTARHLSSFPLLRPGSNNNCFIAPPLLSLLPLSSADFSSFLDLAGKSGAGMGKRESKKGKFFNFVA